MKFRLFNPATSVALISLAMTGVSADEPVPATIIAAQNTQVTPAISGTSLTTARIQAASLHEAMHATLQITHDRFYREDEGLPIPAATMKDVFAELKQKQQITLRWLVVEGQAMNTDHEAKTQFEKDAVKALKAGEPFHEQVSPDVYRRAGSITLSNHCLKCHLPDRRSTRDRTAGLMITIPLGSKASAASQPAPVN